jgi:hypothetical protein
LKQTSSVNFFLGFLSILLVIGGLGLFLFPGSRSSSTAPAVNVEDIEAAPEGALMIQGQLQLALEEPYTRSYSVLGKPQTEVLRVVPLTGKDWRATQEVEALAILRGDIKEAAFHGPAVNLGSIDPAWKAPFALSKKVALLELVPAEPPAWWLALLAFALIVFLGLGIRGIFKRIQQ